MTDDQALKHGEAWTTDVVAAALDAVDEAIVLRDHAGIVRFVNERAERLFEVKASAEVGVPVVQLLRKIALQTEDPEGFMETFQSVRGDPSIELRAEVEQILPERRSLRLYSRPVIRDRTEPAGRVDVYSDVTESERRAAEIHRLYEDARKTAESYQRSLLPERVPRLPRVGFVAHYVAAAGRRAVCGDFYDFVSLPDGRAGLVVADTCGIGPGAVNDAALTRYTLRSLASEKVDPAVILQQLNLQLYGQIRPECFVRVILGALDPERAVFEYANAGHVPPVRYRASTGEVEWLEDGGLPIGVESDVAYKVGRTELDPGDMLILYTDGVTEAPRAGRPLGRGRFTDLVTQYGAGTPAELVQAVRRAVQAWVGGGDLRDDLAMIVCQVAPDPMMDELVRELVVPNDPARLADIRAFVADFLVDLRASVQRSSEILIAVGEASANACRHGKHAGARDEIRVSCAAVGPSVMVTVVDEGPGFADDSSRAAPRDRFAPGGRGLFLMNELMDALDIETSRTGTSVTLIRSLL
ncbi:MAG: SpoIIE family protein phosphatase [Actinomycetota bacterium]|nr:SpoIIE family protein phosphatase [Actinomycetota bacterium]